MSSRDRWLFALLAVLVVVVVMIGGAKQQEAARNARPSTFLSSPGGTRAIFLTLAKLGVPTGRRLTPYVEADSLAGPLALLAPSEPPTPAELHTLATWVRGGGTLFYAARPGDATLDSLGLKLKPLLSDSAGFLGVLRWRGVPARPQTDRLTAGTGVVHPFRFGFASSSALLADSSARPLLVARDSVVTALAARVGKGRVIALSDAAPLANGVVGESGIAPLFARAAAEAGGRVVFDEYHHGFRAGGNAFDALVGYLRRTGPGHALLQLALLGVLLLLAAGWRFGAPLPPPPARRRDPLEHVHALGEAYRRAGARRTARRLLLAGLLRRLGRRVRAGDEEESIAALRHSLPPAARESADALAAEWARDDRADLTALARHMDRILTETHSG